MTGTVSWILSLKAITDALIGLGVLKGKNCQVKSVVHSGTATVITFAWYDDDDVLQETLFTVYDGVNGIDGQDGAPGDPGANGINVVSVEITDTNHLVFTMSNDTTIDAGVISGGGSGAAVWGSIGGTITDQTDLQAALTGKVSTVSGKGLSTNDYTDADKEKVTNALTEHQSLSNYYTKSQTDSAIATEGSKYNPSNNFKTVNGNSIIGTGNIEISGGGSGGTTVVANPELVGTEADLEGLQVGDTKYKVPTGGGSYTLPTASASTKGGIKIGEGLSIDGEVLNADSEVYVGSVEPSDNTTKLWLDTSSSPSGSDALTLLWTNADAGAAGHKFAGRTITVDLTNYTAIYVVVKVKAGYSSCVTQLCIKGITNRLFVGAYSDGVHFYDRLVAMTNAGVQFYDASVDGTTDNTVLFPLYIYGTK